MPDPPPPVVTLILAPALYAACKRRTRRTGVPMCRWVADLVVPVLTTACAPDLAAGTAPAPTPRMAALLSLLAAADGPLSAADLADRWGTALDLSTIHTTLVACERAGWVSRTRAPRKSNQGGADYWTLTALGHPLLAGDPR